MKSETNKTHRLRRTHYRNGTNSLQNYSAETYIWILSEFLFLNSWDESSLNYKKLIWLLIIPISNLNSWLNKSLVLSRIYSKGLKPCGGLYKSADLVKFYPYEIHSKIFKHTFERITSRTVLFIVPKHHWRSLEQRDSTTQPSHTPLW